jgi:hypothetical protein
MKPIGILVFATGIFNKKINAKIAEMNLESQKKKKIEPAILAL